MTKKDLEKRVIELEDLVNHQKRLIDVLYFQLDEKVPPTVTVDNETCPLGGVHQYLTYSSVGWTCKCGKSLPISYSPSTITVSNTKE